MQHILVAEKSLLVGDRFAELLVRYAALVARIGGGELVVFAAIDGTGGEVRVNALLDSGTLLVSETAHSENAEPDNAAAERDLEDRLANFAGHPGPEPEQAE